MVGGSSWGACRSGEELDDNELVTRTLGRDLRSYEELVGRYERLVGRVVYPYAAWISVEDFVQETFLRAYDRLETFNPDYRFKTWLLAIANNLGVDTYGAAGRSSSSIRRPTPSSHGVLKQRPSMPTVPGGKRGDDPARDLRRLADPPLHRGPELRGDSRGALHHGACGEGRPSRARNMLAGRLEEERSERSVSRRPRAVFEWADGSLGLAGA